MVLLAAVLCIIIAYDVLYNTHYNMKNILASGRRKVYNI